MKVKILNSQGQALSAYLDLPKSGKVKAYAIFAHCFTCSKSLSAVRNISRAITTEGFGLLRFDFTGLGNSEGDFSDTNFSSNVDDLLKAIEFMAEHYETPQMLIGHSLGGAAVLSATALSPSIKAVATIGAPFGPEHVKHMFDHKLTEIKEAGAAQINIGGRPFLVKKQFVDDLYNTDPDAVLNSLGAALLILHSPQDRIVEIDNASKLYVKASHPKSFVSLDGADHLLSRKADSLYAGQVISAWASRYLETQAVTNEEEEDITLRGQVSVKLSGQGYTTDVHTADHHLIADEPESLGGRNLGPGPFDLLLSSLGSCTAMTLRMYANRKKWDLQDVEVHMTGDRSDEGFTIHREILMEGNLDEAQKTRLKEIADKCPVHKTLEGKISVVTK